MAKSKLTAEMRKKLEELAELDAGVGEMAMYCGVTRQTIHNWSKEEPEFFDHLEVLREKPILTARRTVTAKMKESYPNAMDYLKRKRKKEFGDSQSVEITTPKPLLDVLSEDATDKGE